MKSGDQKCGTCGSVASLVCGGCGEVAYCSKEHQKTAWKSGHKNQCKAYKIETHPEWGRYLVASRDLKPGNRILTKLKPAVVGPPLTSVLQGSSILTCLGCNVVLNKPIQTCSACKYLFCSNKCSSFHKENESDLCSSLAQMNPEAVQGSRNVQLVTPLKFLLLKKSNPDLFAKLTMLESHVEDVKKSPRWKDFQSAIIDPLEKQFNINDISQVIGIICTNSFELIKPQTSTTQHGLFELASLMNHDCIGNTRLVIDDTPNEGFKLSIYASVTIAKGSPILFNYVKPLDCHQQRAESLLDFKFFVCKCSRCQDPCEFQTFNSAYACPTCQVGPVVLDQDEKWTCQDCQAVISDSSKIKHIDLEIANARKKLGKIQARVDLAQAKQMDAEFQRLLYPSHGFMLEIKQALITCTAAALNNPGPEGEPQMQRQRIEWCQQILDSLDILEPGLSIGRAMVMYEKQSSLVRLANIEFEKDPSRPEELLKVLLEGMSLLQEAKTSLDLEPMTSPMARYVHVINEDIKELSDYIEMVRELM